MKATKLILFNTSTLTGFGTYTYREITLDEARAIVLDFQHETKTIQSAIGHEATAELLSELLGIEVQVNHFPCTQTIDDAGLVFKLNGRPPFGRVLSRKELEEMGYQLGLLTKVD